ncbi:MAG: hypothetical protein P4L74_02640 [Candidatus Doudnabacteria bacterium]|nr:hypothetical protein [Candidatus Doudnabacteria bacterium]
MTWRQLDREIDSLWQRWARVGSSLADFMVFCDEAGALESALSRAERKDEYVPAALCRRLAQFKDWAFQKPQERFNNHLAYSD